MSTLCQIHAKKPNIIHNKLEKLVIFILQVRKLRWKIENLNKFVQLESGRVQVCLTPKPCSLHNNYQRKQNQDLEFQHLLSWWNVNNETKNTCRLKLVGNFLNLTMNIYKKPTDNIILNAERLNVRRLFPKTGNKAGKFVLTTSIKQFIEGPN